MEKPIFKFAIREDLKQLSNYRDFLPSKAEPFATGWDVRAAQLSHEGLVIKPGDYVKIPLGFRAIPPPGWWFEIHPRSSSFFKKNLHVLVGIIDETYPDEVSLLVNYIPSSTKMCKDLTIQFGERLGQMMPVHRVDMEINDMSNEDFDSFIKNRGAERTGGIGSTDQKGI